MTPPVNPVRGQSSRASSTTSLTLLQRAKDQDQLAWRHLVTLYAPLVYRVCRLAHVAPQDAPDIVQEVFRAASGNIGRFHRDRDGDSFRAWLLTISKNKIRDHFRRRAKTPPAVGGTDMQVRVQQLPELTWDSTSDGSGFDSDSSLIQRAVRLVRDDFADRTWQAFWMTTIDGLDPLEVAQRLEISKSSVYQAKTRVLRRMREELGGLLD